MPETIANLDAAITAIKTTTSGLVEWGQGDSLDNVTNIERDIFLERGVYQAASIADLVLIPGTEAQIAIVTSEGLFAYAASGTPDGINIFAAAGGGVWIREGVVPAQAVSALANLSDVALASLLNGQALVYNSATSEWINQTISVAWSAVTSKPTTIAGFGITDLIVAIQPASGSNNDNITVAGALPAAVGATYNVILGKAALPNFGVGNYNFYSAPRGLSDVYGGENSVVITSRTSLHAGVVGNRLVDNSVVIGDCGALDAYYVSDSLTNVIAIGTNGTPFFVVNNSGAMTLNAAANVVGDFTVATNKFTVAAATGNTVIAGTFALTGNLTINTNKFTVNASTGETVIGAALTVATDVTARDIYLAYNSLSEGRIFFPEGGPGSYNSFKGYGVASAAVALSTTSYWAVEIGGTSYKIGIVT